MQRSPRSDRPRERLYFSGPTALADAELLALQLGSGRRGEDAVQVAREILAVYGSLGDLAAREAIELARHPGEISLWKHATAFAAASPASLAAAG